MRSLPKIPTQIAALHLGSTLFNTRAVTAENIVTESAYEAVHK